MKLLISIILVGVLVHIFSSSDSSSSSASSSTSHTVKSGDTIYALSNKYDVSIKRIQSLNNLKGTNINVGQVLMIRPEAVGATAAALAAEGRGGEKMLANSPRKPHFIRLQLGGLELLKKKQRGIVREQILLDRNGMGPGIIDGNAGGFTETAKLLAAVHRPEAFNDKAPLLVERTIPFEAFTYLNKSLPGTGAKPDFKEATKQQCLMMYKTALEMLAERYHSSEALLEQLNPNVNFSKIVPGQKILTPNVAEFKIEDFMSPEGKRVRSDYLRKTRTATRVDIDYANSRVMVYRNSGRKGARDELLASFPVTTNVKRGPTRSRVIQYFAPAPSYAREKTGLKLRPGPNSPVGIVWGGLGGSYGIHGTSDGAGNGYNISSGCIRLSNWDMTIFVKLVPVKTRVKFLVGRSSLISKH